MVTDEIAEGEQRKPGRSHLKNQWLCYTLTLLPYFPNNRRIDSTSMIFLAKAIFILVGGSYGNKGRTTLTGGQARTSHQIKLSL